MDKHTIESLANQTIKTFSPITDSRLEKTYNVFLLVTTENKKFILKKITRNEYSLNRILQKHNQFRIMPAIRQTAKDSEGNWWMTTDYVAGDNLSILNPAAAELLGEALAELVSYFWSNPQPLKNISPSIDDQIAAKERFLCKIEKNTVMHEAYLTYIQRFVDSPKSLCHDDLLPINVLYDNKHNNVKIIDWEHGRLSSYISDTARFATFYNKDRDKFKRGLTFLDDENSASLFLTAFYTALTAELKAFISKEQFLYDYHLESYNQLLLNISHLKEITPEAITNDWEHYFYEEAYQKAHFLNVTY
ncbi:aminoglycoside phosphotransferase family protein [Vagococcus acidifermentans]|uniref:Aminoglycoside phosphotransferase domain-containing protein n=1 Tax=Vagococcus acidifermentans TaxID=564710 RepID=A0A430AMB8_9ENTE|nr:aminoglycoside phosphotransferase family protein [Vagococcus acidifermentans]RSU09245.1 hypothetical protein CBF27_13190 [Vagococcus acidifermentans]